MIEFLNIPLPPTDNHLYINIRRGRLKSPDYRNYEADFSIWCYQNHLALKEGAKALEGGYPLAIEIDFKFAYAKLFCKDGPIKKMDVSNRLKCFLDLVSKSLQFDDSRFFRVSCQKSIAVFEGVNIKILATDVQNEAKNLQK